MKLKNTLAALAVMTVLCGAGASATAGIVLPAIRPKLVSAPVGVLIQASTPRDMVYDPQRDVIYITSGTQVLRYQVSAASFLTPIAVGGALAGVDLSPDGTTLAVADQSSTATQSWVHLIDLGSMVDNKHTWSTNGGTFDVAYGDDGSLLVVQGSIGYSELRRLDTGTWYDVSQVDQQTMLSASGDGQMIAIAESGGAWGHYKTMFHFYTRLTIVGNFRSNYGIATNVDGSQYALSTSAGTFIYGLDSTQIAFIGVPRLTEDTPLSMAFSAAYHLVENLAYFPWAGSTEVRVYEMTGFTQVGSYDFGQDFSTVAGQGLGRIRLSRDGSLLMVIVDGGVRILRMYGPLTAGNISTGTLPGQAVTMTLAGTIGNGGQITYALPQPPAHGTATVSGDKVTYVPAPGFAGTDNFSYQAVYGRALAQGAISIAVVEPNHPPIAVDDSIQLTVNKAALIDVLANDSDPDGQPLTITMATQPGDGAVAIQNNKILYTPPSKSYGGSRSFAYTASDGHGGTATAHVTVKLPIKFIFNPPPRVTGHAPPPSSR